MKNESIKDTIGEIIYLNKEYNSEYIINQVDDIRVQIKNITKQHPIETMGIYTERTPLLLATMLAAFLEHIPFLLMDRIVPTQRMRDMLSIGKVDCIFSEKDMEKKDFGEIPVFYYEENAKSDYEPFDDVLEDYKDADEDEIAYILFTSGSTGTPKAVEVRRKGLLHFIEKMPTMIPFVKNEKIACITRISFDIFFLESLLSILKGLKVVLLSEEEIANPKRIIEVLNREKIDMLQITPSRLKVLALHDKKLQCIKDVKRILVGGESFPATLLPLLKEETKAEIFNVYGPTETTIWSTVSNLTHKEVIDIGEPIGETSIYILDEQGNELPTGEQGEICIGGAGLAKGYRDNEAQTKKAFVTLKDGKTPIYRTGDLGVYDEDGKLFCLGRTDNQIKRLGYRIELDEIDNYLFHMDLIKLSVTCCEKKEDQYGDLITYYVADDWIPVQAFHDYLEKYLPSYMIPSQFNRVSEIFYTASGKVDRRAMLSRADILIDETAVNGKSAATKEVNDSVAEFVLETINEVTNKDFTGISCETTLIELGINSVQYATIVVNIEDEYDFDFDTEMSLTSKELTFGKLVDYVKENVLEEM